jgi:hypothetical protein
MKRFFALTSVSVFAVLGLSIGVADAARPANQACVGKSFSALASSGPGFGQGVRGFAQDPNLPSLGVGIQALQAGGIDDGVVPNSCND